MLKRSSLIRYSIFIFTAVSSASTHASPRFNQLLNAGIEPKALQVALKAYEWARVHGEIHKPIMTLVDFNQPSVKKRLWIIDMSTGQILFNGLVAHGKGSGNLYATHFSDIPGSKASVLGAMVTGQTYDGKHGLELKIHGLEKGLNNNVYNRAIIFHSAFYVTPNFVKAHGYVGRSWGCFAVDPKASHYIINKIKGGSFVFAYASKESKDKNFIENS